MKTVSRMILRYISAAFAMVLLVMTVNLTLFLGVVVYFGSRGQQEGFFSIRTFANAFVEDAEQSLYVDPAVPWQEHFVWAMLLDDQGQILWSQSLPQELDHPYTVPEVASFSRWYLRDYPVMVYRNDYGLLVAGKPKDSITRFDFYMENDILNVLLSGIGPMLVLDLLLVLGICLLMGWHGAKPLRKIGKGIASLAEGKAVCLQEVGATAELAEKLNQTSRHLQRQNQLIAQRDMTRANWIAGVSHDIRTPLSLIMGYGEQLALQLKNQPEQEKKANAICRQSQKIKALIEDLNLTFKLQYHAQPLRQSAVAVGPWIRKTAAEFCDTLDEAYSIELEIQKEAGQMVLEGDEELLTRALDNLLNNCVRHNAPGCEIGLSAQRREDGLYLTVWDNGQGYPQAVLDQLAGGQTQGNGPHILGLYLVQQILTAHGAGVQFHNHQGAVVQIRFPLPKIET